MADSYSIKRKTQGCALSCNALSDKYVAIDDRLHIAFFVLNCNQYYSLRIHKPCEYTQILPNSTNYISVSMYNMVILPTLSGTYLWCSDESSTYKAVFVDGKL